MFGNKSGEAFDKKQILTQQVWGKGWESPFSPGDNESAFGCSRKPSPVLKPWTAMPSLPWSQDVQSCLNNFRCPCFKFVPGPPPRPSTCLLGNHSDQYLWTPFSVQPDCSHIWSYDPKTLIHSECYRRYTTLLFPSAGLFRLREDNPYKCGLLLLFPRPSASSAMEARTHILHMESWGRRGRKYTSKK